MSRVLSDSWWRSGLRGRVWIAPRLRQLVHGLVASRLAPPGRELPALERAVRLAHRLRGSAAMLLFSLAGTGEKRGAPPLTLPTQ